MTFTLQRILVPVDFGEASAAAVSLAVKLAQGCGAEVTLLHAEALEAPVYFTSDQVEKLARERRSRRAQAQKYLEAFGRRHAHGADVPVKAVIETRPPIEAIEQRVSDTDLIVIGTHGRSGPSLWWLGSVTERVLRNTTRPVLVVHAHDQERPAVEKLAVYAAPGLRGEAALALASRIGRAFGAQVADRRADAPLVSEMFDDVWLVVVAEPAVHDRQWRTSVGEPLIRAGAGPVLFVPEATLSS